MSSRPRPRAPWGLATVTVVAAVAWGAALVLADLPRTDGAGRQVLYVWHRTSGWWQSLVTLVASVLTMVLAVWLPVVVVRRWVPARWRAITASVGAVAVLALGGWLALLSFVSLLGAGLEGTQTLVTAPDGRRVLVTQDGFDGDVVGIWQPTGSHTWVREPSTASVDPGAGPCRLQAQGDAAVLVCGQTSQPLAPPPR